MKLIAVEKSPRKEKKWMAVFKDGEKIIKTHFGSAGMKDYTLRSGKATKEERDRYRTRHSKDLETGDPTRAGFLAYYILWGDSTSIGINIMNYKKKFNL
jgi:hypothetical protein